MNDPGFETICAHWEEDPDQFLGAVTPPIFQSSLFTSPDTATFIERGSRHPEVYDYTRTANPTTDILQAKIAALERTESARSFGSGNAAIAAAVMHCVRAGDHVVAVSTIYGPTRALLSGYLPRFDISVTYVRGDDPQQFADATRPNTKLYYLESPSSLVFNLQDLAAVAALAKERGITTVADNSWASPYFQNPIELGVDMVVHSATKYLGGHSDIVAGVVAGSSSHLTPIAQEATQLGAILDPFASWLMIRGLRTLALRMERHQQSGMAVAEFLAAHRRIARVHYPGLDSHPQHALGERQMRGTSGLLSFELKDGSRESACAVVDRLKYFGIGVSWGGFESLAIPVAIPQKGDNSPAYLPGVGSEPADDVRWGARIHVGLETVDDLLGDLDHALK